MPVHTPGVSIEQRVRDHCDRHGLLPAGSGVLALVSGGADSMCLLHVLATVHDGPVHVLSIDHGFRPEASDEARAVADAARALGVAAHVEHLGLAPGPAAMERARDARLAVAEAVRAREGLACIATGHTRTDHVETVLFRMARGTGRTGALGIAPRRDRLVRPLLGISRDDARAWCLANAVSFVDDPTNADERTARARVRHGLVPALARVHPAAEANVARLADLLADEAEVIAQAVDAAWSRNARDRGLNAAGLVAEPVAMGRLLVRRLLRDAGLAGDALAADVVDDVLARAAAGGPARDVPGGLVAVDRGVVVAERAGRSRLPQGVVGPVALPVPGAACMGHVRVSATTGTAGASRGDCAWVRADVGRAPLVLRPASPGDRIALAGGGHQAVGRLLQGAGVPSRHRAAVPVVAQGDRVVWVAGHRASADLLAAPGEPAVRLMAVAA